MSRWLFRIATLYLLAGVVLGMFMAATHNHAETSLHAHMNLLGFMTLAIAGLWYRVQPDAAETWLAKAHFVLHNAGLPVMSVGLYFLLQGKAAAEPAVAAGASAVVVGILCLVLNAWRLTGSAWDRAPLVSAER